jgi:hypothetical protein
MTAAQFDLLGLLATITDDQGDEETPQGWQEAPEAAAVGLTDPYDPEAAWQGFTPDTTDDEGRRLFAARYGRPPARVWRRPGLLLAGPV